jgi:DNA replication and repair protein RecF
MNIVKKINLENIRIHSRFSVDFKNPTTLIIGENGSGKTSVIEALYITLQGRSFRSRDRDIIKDGKKDYKINTFLNKSGKIQVEYSLENNKKTFIIDDKKYHRLPNKFKYPVVLFEPDDLNLLHGSPNRRRNHLDSLLSVLNPKYHTYLLRYEKAVLQRNNTLKRDFCSHDDVFAWDILIAKYGSEILAIRCDTVLGINSRLQSVYRSIAINSDIVGVEYSSNVISESQYLRKLTESFEKDRILGQTTFGPHRDDINFNFNGKSAMSTSSRGEIRTMVLSLKFIEAELIEKSLLVKPIILLDDIFSELDDQRQKQLIDGFKNNQVVITSVSPPIGMREDVEI